MLERNKKKKKFNIYNATKCYCLPKLNILKFKACGVPIGTSKSHLNIYLNFRKFKNFRDFKEDWQKFIFVSNSAFDKLNFCSGEAEENRFENVEMV